MNIILKTKKGFNQFAKDTLKNTGLILLNVYRTMFHAIKKKLKPIINFLDKASGGDIDFLNIVTKNEDGLINFFRLTNIKIFLISLVSTVVTRIGVAWTELTTHLDTQRQTPSHAASCVII